jgi:cytochrome c biogenesis protein CcmG, thiol:disulfide interchange protein DsbE
MRKLIVIGALAAVLTACSSQAAQVTPPAGSDDRALTAEMTRLEPCPEPAEGVDLALPGLPAVILPCLGQGPSVDLAYVRGTPLVVNVWASWCPPCVEEMPLLADMAREYGPEVRFLGIDLQDDESRALEMLADFDITYPSVVDKDGIVRPSLGVSGPPVTFFVKADGVIAGRWDGLIPNEEIFDGLMETYLGLSR